MTKRSVEAIVEALNAHDVRYLIAGGLAVAAHGYVRFTADVDMIIALDPENVSNAIAALEGLGYRPRAPVGFHELANPDKRREWARDKGMTVFAVYSPIHVATELDIFAEAPLDFERAYADATRIDVAPGIPATFVSYADLIQLKQKAGRPQDAEDIEHLTEIRGKERP